MSRAFIAKLERGKVIDPEYNVCCDRSASRAHFSAQLESTWRYKLQFESDNVRVHRAAANKLNIENRAARGLWSSRVL